MALLIILVAALLLPTILLRQHFQEKSTTFKSQVNNLHELKAAALQEKQQILAMPPGESQILAIQLWNSKLHRYLIDSNLEIHQE